MLVKLWSVLVPKERSYLLLVIMGFVILFPKPHLGTDYVSSGNLGPELCFFHVPPGFDVTRH
jgi:hypothetical protein